MFKTALALLLFASPALASGPMTTVDPLGHKTVLNEGGALPSPEGTVYTFSPIDADIETIIQGANGEALMGLTALIFVARTTAVGISMARPDLANPDVLRLAPTVKQYIAVGPTDSWLKFVKLQPFSYSFSLGEDSGFTGGKFSADFKLTAGVEVPLGADIAFQGELGILTTLTHLEQDVTNTVDPMFGGTFVYRIRPKPRG